MYSDIVTTNTNVWPSKVAQSSNGCNAWSVYNITIIVQNVHVDANFPSFSPGDDTQWFSVDTSRITQTTFQESVDFNLHTKYSIEIIRNFWIELNYILIFIYETNATMGI